MYMILVRFDVRPECHQDFQALAQRHAEESLREETDTLVFHIVEDEEHPDRFYAIEGYTDRTAYEAHQQGPVLARNGPLVRPMLATPLVALGRGVEVAG